MITAFLFLAGVSAHATIIEPANILICQYRGDLTEGIVGKNVAVPVKIYVDSELKSSFSKLRFKLNASEGMEGGLNLTQNVQSLLQSNRLSELQGKVGYTPMVEGMGREYHFSYSDTDGLEISVSIRNFGIRETFSNCRSVQK